MEFIVLSLVALLVFANGANDNCKGVATLVGYGAAGPRAALVWAAVTTALGAAASFWLAAELVRSFSGSALFTRAESMGATFFVSVLAGAFGWVIFATFTGLPVSTTHAITGALTGAGLVAFGAEQIRWSVLGVNFAMPLALGPVLSVAVVYLLAMPLMWFVSRAARQCICVLSGTQAISASQASGAATGVLARHSIELVVDQSANCAERSPAIAVDASAALNVIHWASSGMIGFARGWNDAPKVAALALVALPANAGGAFAIVTIAMAIGGLVAGRNVLVTLAHRVTELPPHLLMHPVRSADDYLRAMEEAERFRHQSPMIPDQSIDVIVSNCVLNLVATSAKTRLFDEMFRVLKVGGRCVISDIVSDEDVPEDFQDDPHLWSGCISGAFREDLLLKAFEDAGFYGITILERADAPWQTIRGIEFRAVTVVAYKGNQVPCFERNQAVIYKGPWKKVIDDDGHVLERGQRMAVCDKTYRLYQREPYREQFWFVEPRNPIPPESAKPFDCHGSARRDPRQTKGQDYHETTAASECCGPDGCC